MVVFHILSSNVAAYINHFGVYTAKLSSFYKSGQSCKCGFCFNCELVRQLNGKKTKGGKTFFTNKERVQNYLKKIAKKT